jgi:hypothetical protein
MESHGGMIMTGENGRTLGKTCPSAVLSTTSPTWTDSGANPSLHNDRPMTNRLSHGVAFKNKNLTENSMRKFFFTFHIILLRWYYIILCFLDITQSKPSPPQLYYLDHNIHIKYHMFRLQSTIFKWIISLNIINSRVFTGVPILSKLLICTF